MCQCSAPKVDGYFVSQLGESKDPALQ